MAEILLALKEAISTGNWGVVALILFLAPIWFLGRMVEKLVTHLLAVRMMREEHRLGMLAKEETKDDDSSGPGDQAGERS